MLSDWKNLSVLQRSAFRSTLLSPGELVELGLFFYCGSSPRPAQTVRWADYLASEELVQDLEESFRRQEDTPRSVEVAQVWWYMEGGAFIQTTEEQWYSCGFKAQERDGSYLITYLRSMPRPDPEQRDDQVIRHRAAPLIP